MHVVHLLRKYNPDEWGGTETAIQRLFEGLREHGVTPAMFCPALDHEPRKDPLRAAGFRIERFRAFVPVLGISAQRKRQLVSVGGNLMSFDLMPSLWRESNVSLIHTHTLGRIGGIALTVAKQRRVPLVVTIHGGVFDVPPEIKKCFNTPVGGWEWGRFFGLIFQSHRLFPEADAIITCNTREAKLLQEKYPARRVVVQPHGVPVARYREDHREAASAAFPQIRGRQVLLCAGRIDPVKNQGWVIDRMPRILETHPGVLLVLTGACTDELYGKEIQRKIESLGLQDRVLLTGGLPPGDPRLIGLFQQAEVLILPSVSETFGLVILEAWAAGTKVLSSRTSGASAVLRDGDNGWLFHLDNPQTFHERLDQALNGSDAVKQIHQRGCEEVNREYDIVSLAGRMKRLYEELIEEKKCVT